LIAYPMLPASHEEQVDGPEEPGKTCGPRDLIIKGGYWRTVG
jgi:hypothetical protein